MLAKYVLDNDLTQSTYYESTASWMNRTEKVDGHFNLSVEWKGEKLYLYLNDVSTGESWPTTIVIPTNLTGKYVINIYGCKTMFFNQLIDSKSIIYLEANDEKITRASTFELISNSDEIDEIESSDIESIFVGDYNLNDYENIKFFNGNKSTFTNEEQELFAKNILSKCKIIAFKDFRGIDVFTKIDFLKNLYLAFGYDLVEG